MVRKMSVPSHAHIRTPIQYGGETFRELSSALKTKLHLKCQFDKSVNYPKLAELNSKEACTCYNMVKSQNCFTKGCPI